MRIHLEAKLLEPRPLSRFPREYVNEGMMRFISGAYPIAPGYAGLMVAYVLSGSPTESFEAVNASIAASSILAASDFVKLSEKVGDVVELYDSDHSTCSLLHIWIDLTARRPSWTAMLARGETSLQEEGAESADVS